MGNILVVDDDTGLCLFLKDFLQRNNYKVKDAYRGVQALQELQKAKFDLVLCDFRLPDINGLEVLQEIKRDYPSLPVIIMTAYSDIKMAVNVIKAGAYEYLVKSLNNSELLYIIERALENDHKKESNFILEKDEDYLIGNNKLMKIVFNNAKKVAQTDMSVILQGETGTGKEVIAKIIHAFSQRKDKPFVAIDCGALPKELAGSELFGHEKGAFTGAINTKPGQFEIANGGTLFLDEITNLSYEVQTSLLRVLQEKQSRRLGSTKVQATDVRIIVASNEVLKNAVKSGKFREDLFFRLNEFNLTLPPLRERKEDLINIANFFLIKSNHELNKHIKSFDEKVLECFKSYTWFGNMREMKNIVKRAVLMTDNDVIDLDCIPEEMTYPEFQNQSLHLLNNTENKTSELKNSVIEAESKTIMEELKKTRYNKSKAAKELHIDRKTLYNKLKKYNLLDEYTTN